MVANKEETLEQYLRQRIPGKYSPSDSVNELTGEAAEKFIQEDFQIAEICASLAEYRLRRKPKTLEDFRITKIPRGFEGEDISKVVDEFYESRGYTLDKTILGVIKIFRKSGETLIAHISYNSPALECLVTIERLS